MTLISQITAVPDYAAIKSKQNASWASGDYARIGATLHIVGETLAEALEPTSQLRSELSRHEASRTTVTLSAPSR